MRKFYTALAALMLCAGAALACFYDDPESWLQHVTTTVTGDDGGNTGIEIPGRVVEKPENITDYSRFAVVVESAFPVTVNVSLSKFIGSQGYEINERPTRICLLQYAKYSSGSQAEPVGEWIIIQDIRNPKFEVYSDTPLAVFGRWTVTSAMGYTDAAHPVPLIVYYEIRNGEYSNFKLNNVLYSSTRFPAGTGVIGIVPATNIRPL